MRLFFIESGIYQLRLRSKDLADARRRALVRMSQWTRPLGAVIRVSRRGFRSDVPDDPDAVWFWTEQWLSTSDNHPGCFFANQAAIAGQPTKGKLDTASSPRRNIPAATAVAPVVERVTYVDLLVQPGTEPALSLDAAGALAVPPHTGMEEGVNEFGDRFEFDEETRKIYNEIRARRRLELDIPEDYDPTQVSLD